MNEFRVSRRLLLASTLGALVSGCTGDDAPGGDSPGAPPLPNRSASDTGAFKNLDPWLLTTTNPDANRGNLGIGLSDGLVGATFGANGGAPEDARLFHAGIYDASETIAPFPNVHGIVLPIEKSGYSQTLDLKRGVLVTKTGGATVTTLVSDGAIGINVAGAPKPSSPPTNPDGMKGLVVRADDRAEPDGSWTRVVDFVDASGRDNRRVLPAFDVWRKQHEAAWAKNWEHADIVIDGDPEAQQLVRKLVFDLLQSAAPNSDFSVAPEGLFGEFYKGHIFWDADVWVFPALLALDPDRARSLLNYRFRTLSAAKANAAAQKLPGADFAWESAATGRETIGGSFSQGRHVTAGVAWAHGLYFAATQDRDWLNQRGWPVLSAVADYFCARAQKTPAGYSIGPVNGPDELNPSVTDNAYTNAMVKAALSAALDAAKTLGKPAPPLWNDVRQTLIIPFDKARGVYLKCVADDGKATKQADGELLLWPARLPMDAKTAGATFDFHSKRPIKNGPAMTDAMHALIAARLGRASEAEENFRESYRPFVRGPFLLFSEKRSLERCVFVTGVAGVLQSVLYGFGGLDFASWNTMKSAPIALPASWKSLAFQTTRAGKRHKITVTPEGRKIEG